MTTRKRSSFLSRMLSLILVSFLITGVWMTSAFADVVDTDVSKAIAVAFDNSGSMSESTDCWCTAKYSLEVLAAMMGSEDTLIIEPMETIEGRNTGYEVHGSQPASERVALVHNSDLGTAYYTDPGAAASALEKLLAVPADEHYLVITTDGKFMSVGGVDGIEIVRQTVAQCGQSNPPVKVLYLAIGDDADTIDAGKNVYVEEPGEGTEVLESMKKIANIIYGRARLDSSYFNAKTGKLSFDTPMGSLIVLAQGKGAQAGAVTWSEGSSRPDTASVRYCQHPYEITDELRANKLYKKSDYEEKYYKHAKVNKDLVGMVGSYSDRLPAGEYKLNASGSNIEVYYKPYVDVAVVLQDANGLTFNLSDTAPTNPIPHGDYTVSYQLRDPETKRVLNSKLLKGGDFSVRVEDGESSTTYGNGDVIALEPGHPNLVATVELPSHVRVTRKFKDVKVAADSQPLDVDLSEVPVSYDVEGYERDESAGTIRISKKNGEEITPDEWERMVVSMRSEDGPEWSVKTNEPGIVSVRPSYGSGSPADEEQRLLSVPLPVLDKWLRVTHEDYPTSVTAYVPDDIRPYAGGGKTMVTVTCSWTHSVLRWLIALAVFLFIVWLLWFFLTWPKLPKYLDPCLEIQSMDEEVILEFDTNLRPKSVLVHDSGHILPRRTQRMTFGPGFMRVAENLPEAINGASFEIEAVPHGFRLTAESRERVEALAETNGFEWENIDFPRYRKGSTLTCSADTDHMGYEFTATYIVYFENPSI